MKKAIEYIVGVSMLIIVFIAASFCSDSDAVLTFSFLLLIIVLTIQSISDSYSQPVTLLQLAASAVLGIFSGLPFCCLLFSQVRTPQYDAIRIFTPAVFCSVSALISGSRLYTALLYAVILVCISAVIFLGEKCLVKYFDTKKKLSHSVSVCALGELSEKKLNEELRIKNYLSDRNARLEERENISRSIHNSVEHSITAAIMTLDAADMLFDTSPDKAREKLGAANERIRDSLASIRRAVRVLDSEDKPVPVSDICDSLEVICKGFTMDTRITVRTNLSDCSPDRLIPSVHAEFFCSAASELLSNGVRHGNADIFLVSLTSDSRHLQLIVTDNGESDFSSENSHIKIQNGFGLKKLISYCEKNGGRAEFSNPAGFKSIITLPIIEEES
ncbi:MAG: hypothetical protein J6L05_05815 [Ruminococcus sp.]|nr:hypothetical protein [Ruminococcus sp.]